MFAVSVRTESRMLWGICTACPVAISTAMVSPNARPTPSSTAASRPRSRRRQQHPPDFLPARRPQRQSRLPIGVRHRLQRVLPDRDDDRHDHQRQDDPAVEDVHPDRSAGPPHNQPAQHRQPNKAPHHARDRRQQLNDDLQRLLGPGLAELRECRSPPPGQTARRSPSPGP